ncbi:hypothetical protein OF83DRAFT_1175689 [Amylostereum chailletii]|nr:hypothetical protein OF83DRAFT_1175689 [Amylostereum chailletii]
MATSRDALWNSGHDETVEVNQRALIDKVLARYSGEFTVFRELLQNSDDAASRSVEIRFETEAYLSRQKTTEEDSGIVSGSEKLPDLKTALVHQWTFKNDGVPFRDEDWSWLKKIAEGNPDEEKIGAFGVGFYSLFSVTEEPWVTSGGQWMNFYWKDKKDQLFARRGTLPLAEGSSPDPWTTFQMTLREPTPIPAAFDFTRFLVSSITFMAHLSEVSVYFDDKRLVKLHKSSSLPKTVPMIKGLKASSPQGVMNVRSIQSTPLCIEADVVRWVYTVGTEKPATGAAKAVKAAAQSTGGFFSSLFSGFGGGPSTPQRVPTPLPQTPAEEIDLLEVNSSSVDLTIFAANVEVKLDRKLTTELERSTKKKPPAKLKYELIYTGKDEYDASVKAEEKVKFATGSVFQGLRADLDGSGSARIFIGHSTGQTTGIGGHMATRFIPTVERESVDLVDRNVAVWNKELLYVGGFLARSAYELELANVKAKWEAAAAASSADELPDPEIQAWLRGRALHALKFFTFYSSTPSSVVSSLMESSFFLCATNGHSFPIISSEGVCSVDAVRLPDPVFSGFLKRLPMVPDDVLEGAKLMLDGLRARKMIKDITFVDILKELKSRPLSEAEAVACLKWWIGVSKQSKDHSLLQGRSQLLDAAVITIAGPPERIFNLASVGKFLNPRNMGTIIPTDGPLPLDLLPVTVSRSFDPEVLSTAFPWKQLTILDWLKHVLNPSVAKENPEFDVTLSAPWAERVLSVVARAWPNLAKADQDHVVALLKDKACVPTSAGMRVPEETYFASVKMFSDLPTITLPSGSPVKGHLEKVFQAMGVRRHVELQTVFNRMVKTGDWTIIDMIKYLVTVQATLSGEELTRLKATAAFLKEGDSKEGGKAPRFRASDLYEPVDTLRELKLPLIDWGADNRWRPSSEEAKFLFMLGLRRAPPLPDLLKLAAGPDVAVRRKALAFFLDNFVTKYSDYDPQQYFDLAFIPAVQLTGSKLAKPSEVFANPEWLPLGFAIVASDLRDHALTKLKIPNHPPTGKIVTLLESHPPENEEMARKWFETLSGRIPDFASNELRRLSVTAFVPTKTLGEKGSLKRLPPSQCYFSGASSAEFHSKLFVFIDFGTRANSFLAACGTKQEPSVEEIVQILLRDPRRFYELAGGRDRQGNIALNRRMLSSASLMRMRRADVLLASRRKKRVVNEKSNPDGEEEDWDHEDDLLRPDKVVIADDTNAYQLFGDSVFCAPQEDLLEDFYLSLGSSRLSALVGETYRPSTDITSSSKLAPEIRRLILERLPLFLHEHSQSRTKVSFNWLNNEKNFIVKVFGAIEMTRSLQHGDVHAARKQEASAIAKRDGKGPIQLWLAGNTKVDMYEVSTSLCRFIFESPKANDALLFMTILSTDLKALRRRGYNVDRILKQQQAEREAMEKAVKMAQAQQHPPRGLVSDGQLKQVEGPAPPPFPVPTPVARAAVPAPPTTSEKTSPLPAPPPPAPPEMPVPASSLPNKTSGMGAVFQNFKHKLASKMDNPGPASDAGGSQVATHPGPSRDYTKPPSTQSGSHVTPLSNIASNIDMAIKACTEERSSLLKNREQMQMVKESLDEGYCDVSGRAGDLDLVGNMGDMKVFASADLPDPGTLVQRKQSELQRFIQILLPLCDIYKLSRSSLHVFADKEGQLIAFNRSGSLFVNLRYYEAWHDQEVQRGDRTKAFISWYFTLAHEIAHNLVQPHNSEHEFYFSSICEAYIVPLASLLS